MAGRNQKGTGSGLLMAMSCAGEEAGVCGWLQTWMQMDTGPDVQFGKDVIPHALSDGYKVSAYQFDGFWQVRPSLQALWSPVPPAVMLMDVLGLS